MTRRSLSQLLLGSAAVAGGALPLPALGSFGTEPKKKVLVISDAQGFKHSSRPVAAGTIRALGVATGDWTVVNDLSTPEAVTQTITASGLQGIDLVFFANTTGNLTFSPEGRKAFYDWINAGGAYAGVHSAGDTFHGDADYLNLVRGEFQTHGPQVKVTVSNQDPAHPACKDLPASFEIYDEIYEFKNWERGRVHVLLTMHKHPQRDEQGDFPVAWTNRVGKGRMFYTSLGHREDVYWGNDLYLKHLIGGMRWALGLAKGDDTPGNALR